MHFSIFFEKWNDAADEAVSCFYSQACAGGLRCLAAAVNGNPFTKDPGCWLAGGQDGMR